MNSPQAPEFDGGADRLAVFVGHGSTVGQRVRGWQPKIAESFVAHGVGDDLVPGERRGNQGVWRIEIFRAHRGAVEHVGDL